jgi:hypothetical protein
MIKAKKNPIKLGSSLTTNMSTNIRLHILLLLKYFDLNQSAIADIMLNTKFR